MTRAEAATCCATASRLGEPLLATATETRGWLLLEHRGAWGRDAVLESGLDVDVARELSRRAAAAGVRILLVKRHGRPRPGPGRSAFVMGGLSGDPVHRLPFRHERELLRLGLAPGEAAGWPGEPHTEPLHLVCTHGRRDACCARLGVAVARELDLIAPGSVWECSHLGGHRFAANVLRLPEGIMLGRVEPGLAGELIGRLSKGRVPLAQYRGRCGVPEAAQAAEGLVRARLDLEGIGDVEPGRVQVLDGADGRIRAEVSLGVRGECHRAIVVGLPGEPRPVSCGSPKLERPRAWSLELLEHAAL